MYIRLEDDRHLLIRSIKGEDGKPAELLLADLGSDPELNLFGAAEEGRRKHPDRWDGIEDFHVLQALENFKRRIGHYKPALVVVEGKRRESRE